jgi:hypothetical protein
MGYLCLEDIKLNIEDINENLEYDPVSGIFTRIKNGKRCDSVCTGRYGKQYIRIRVGVNRYKGHRIAAMLLGLDMSNNKQIDHIDGNGLNNSASNLRAVSCRDNAKNQRLSIANKSGVIGVYFKKESQSWHATIRDIKPVHIGYFKDFFEACCARKSAEVRFGFHPNHGMPKQV